jgi:hypothetical protein
MTFAKKLEYLSARKMLVSFYQRDDSDQFCCCIFIARRSPVTALGRTADEALAAAYDRAVFKTEVLRLCAH